MILNITTEKNKEDLVWLKQQGKVLEMMEQVVYDKRNSNISNFIKTELRKYSGFAYLILDADIFEDDNMSEMVRSITYLCTAHLIIIGHGDLILQSVPDGADWIDDITVSEDRYKLLAFLADTTSDGPILMNTETTCVQRANNATMESDKAYFLSRRGIKLACVSMEDGAYDASLALALANRLNAILDANVNYSLIAEDDQQLESLAEQFGFADQRENDGCYTHQGVEYYYNQADENAHFVVMDFQKPKLPLLHTSDVVFFYSAAGVYALEAANKIAEETQPQAIVFACFFDVTENDQQLIRAQLHKAMTPIFLYTLLLQNCLESYNQLASTLLPYLDSLFIIGKYENN